jgi:acyl-CoA thioesterase-1
MKMKRRMWLGLLVTFGLLFASAAQAATVVALGASNTFGKGVSRSQAYPAQLEALLRTKGLNARVINAGINGDTTGGMLARLDRVVPKGTSVVILQPGGNDRRKLAPDKTSEIQARLAAMGIKVVLLPNGMLQGLPHQPDGQHLTPEGYHMLADELVGQVADALKR